MQIFQQTYFILLLGLISIGLCTCSPQKGKRAPIVQTITLMTVSWPDSDTRNIMRHGIRLYIHFDLTNDSISFYRKDGPQDFLYDFDRFRSDTTIAHLRDNLAIKEFLEWTKSYDFERNYKEETQRTWGPFKACCCNYNNYFVKITTDSGENVIAYSTRWRAHTFENLLKFLPGWNGTSKWKKTSKPLNEDSLLVPILARPEFDSIFISPPPPPPPLPKHS